MGVKQFFQIGLMEVVGRDLVLSGLPFTTIAEEENRMLIMYVQNNCKTLSKRIKLVTNKVVVEANLSLLVREICWMGDWLLMKFGLIFNVDYEISPMIHCVDNSCTQ